MFFIAGVYNKQEQLDFHQSMACPHCGQYGQYQAYIQYMVFSFSSSLYSNGTKIFCKK